LHGKFLTKHLSKGISIIQDDLCVLCLQEAETTDHLYFQCPYTAYLWKLCKLKLGITSISVSLFEEVTVISSKFKHKCHTRTLAKLVLSAVIWHIWQERNSRIFNHESKLKFQVFKELYEDVKILMEQCVWEDNMQVSLNSILCNWGITRLT